MVDGPVGSWEEYLDLEALHWNGMNRIAPKRRPAAGRHGLIEATRNQPADGRPTDRLAKKGVSSMRNVQCRS